MPISQPLSEHQLNSLQLPLGVPALLEELQSQGVGAAQVFQAAQLPAKAGSAPAYGPEDLPAILAAAARLAIAPTTALDAGARQKISHFGVFGFALITSNTFGEAFRFGKDHIDLAGAVIEVNFLRQGDRGILQTRNPLMLGGNLQFIAEFWRSAMTTLLSEVLGRPFPSLEMFFPYKKPAYVQVYKDIFQCPLRFDADVMEWHFDARILDAACPNADPMTSKVCQDICDQMANLHGESHLLRSVRSLCMTRSSRAIATAESVADAMGMSVRTFHRRLAGQQTSFKQQLDKTRYSIAVSYLVNTQVTVEEISSRCGYGDVSNFRKAFRRWAGEAPSAFRQRSV